MKMTFKAMNIPLGIDVWNVVESELKTGLKHVAKFSFHYSTERRHGLIDIDYYEEGQKHRNHYINLDDEEAEKLVVCLCTTFNIEWRNIRSLRLKLKPGEMPFFDVEVYPFVDCASKLDSEKSRMMPIKTID